jgi:mRNA-degrading endonuclease toxin of MazEF toxin-antitoxin module
MARILRGDVRWADLNPARGHEQAGSRPVLILSHDVLRDPEPLSLWQSQASHKGQGFH